MEGTNNWFGGECSRTGVPGSENAESSSSEGLPTMGEGIEETSPRPLTSINFGARMGGVKGNGLRGWLLLFASDWVRRSGSEESDAII